MKDNGLANDRTDRNQNAIQRMRDDNVTKVWMSETRSSFSLYPVVPRRRPMPTLDRSRRHDPQPTVAAMFKARYGEKDVCFVDTLLPEVLDTAATAKSSYAKEFQYRPPTACTRIVSAPRPCEGILPSFRVPPYKDVRNEILLPVGISEQSPGTNNPNKYMCRRKKICEAQNQHRKKEIPYSVSSESQTPGSKVQGSCITRQGTPLKQKRHVSAPEDCLPVKNFDGAAAGITNNTMHAKLLPYLRVPNII